MSDVDRHGHVVRDDGGEIRAIASTDARLQMNNQ
jgi:hypothetical protein